MAFSWRAHGDAHSPEPKRLPSKDYAPPERQHADRAIEALKAAQHVVAFNGYEQESEVMPPVSEPQGRSNHTVDTRPPSATEANPLDEIKELVKSLTYEEMMDLAAALWKAHDETSQEDELTEKHLPGILHRWAKEDSKP